jgi:hypothetical protein
VVERVVNGNTWILKTHCIRGHEFTPNNTYTRTRNGVRECKQCRSLRSRKHYWGDVNYREKRKAQNLRRYRARRAQQAEATL